MGQHVLGHGRVNGVGMGSADEVVVRALRRMGWCREHLPALVHLLVAAQIADRVEHGVMYIRLYKHTIMLKHHQRAVVDHALLPKADVAQSTSHLAARQVMICHLDHRGHTAVVRWRLDRVLNAVVGVPVFPVHARQIAAIRSALGFLHRHLVVRDADDVGFGYGLVVAVV